MRSQSITEIMARIAVAEIDSPIAVQRAGAISSYVAPLTQCAWLAWKAGSAAAQARISELEATMDAILKLIDDAPHDGGCDVYVNGLAQMCTCWKSKIGSK